MYQALYRKYRPCCFKDVVGQEHITETLKNELKTGKISHAYLFTGPRGTGKTSCAKILAKAVNCLNSQNGDACCECDVCRAIEAGDVLDIVEIDAASNNGVENIRDLKEQINYTPTSSKYRVYIIDEVHMLSIGAFNALLKTLEEPPKHIIFILATTEVHKLPATILSRCQRFDFHRISVESVASRIQHIAELEGISIEASAANTIASLCDGGLRDALSTLDLCAAKTKDITLNDVLAVCSLTGDDYCLSLSRFIAKGDTAAVLEKIDELHKNAVDLGRLCTQLISHYRNLMVAKTVSNPDGLVVCTPATLNELKDFSKTISLESILNAITVLSEALDRMNYSDRKIELEMAAIRLCSPELDNSISAVLQRLEKIERKLKYSDSFGAKDTSEVLSNKDVKAKSDNVDAQNESDDASLKIKEDSSQKTVDSVASATAESGVEKGSYSSARPFEAWQDILAELQSTTPLLAVSLSGSKAYLNDKGDTLLIDCEDQQFFSFMRTKDPYYRNQIKAALNTIVGRTYRLGPYKKTQESQDPLKEIMSKLKQLEVPEG